MKILSRSNPSSGVSYQELVDWMYDHATAYEDIIYHYDVSSIEELSYEEIMDWIADHDRLYEDLIHHFGHDKLGIESAAEIDSLDGSYWYFTTHGIQPGSVPRGIDIMFIVNRPEGSYFVSDKVLLSGDLARYDLKERAPEGIKYYRYTEYTPGSLEDGMEGDEFDTIVVPADSPEHALKQLRSRGYYYATEDELEESSEAEFYADEY